MTARKPKNANTPEKEHAMSDASDYTAAELAALAGVPAPSSEFSPGAVFLHAVADGVLADLAEVGPGLHLDCVRLAADTAIPVDDDAALAIFTDLFGAMDAERRRSPGQTEQALEAVGQALGVALVARAEAPA